MAEREWAGNTFGSGFMHRWLIRLLRHTDVRLWYAFAAVFVIPFCLLLSADARITYGYFRLRHGYGRMKSLLMSYANLCLFSQVVIDKFALYAGKRMRLKVVGSEHFQQLATASEGFVILSGHIGCYEMAGYELISQQKPFNALVFAGEKASVMQNRERIFDHNNIRMIPIRQDMSHLFEIDRALADGEIMSIPADRIFGSSRTVAVELLNGKAQLPAGPFSVAAMRGLNVVAVNVMKTACREYTAYVTPLHYDKSLPRKQQTGELAQAYANEMGKLIGQYPAQWYNYFRFWDE